MDKWQVRKYDNGKKQAEWQKRGKITVSYLPVFSWQPLCHHLVLPYAPDQLMQLQRVSLQRSRPCFSSYRPTLVSILSEMTMGVYDENLVQRIIQQVKFLDLTGIAWKARQYCKHFGKKVHPLLYSMFEYDKNFSSCVTSLGKVFQT